MRIGRIKTEHIMFKKLWKSIDGYKTLTGIIITGIGGLMFFSSISAPYAADMIVSGVTIAAGGLTHKIIKKNKAEKEIDYGTNDK